MMLAGAGQLGLSEIRKRLRDTGLLGAELDERDEEAAEEEAEELGIDDDGAEREDGRLEDVLDASPVIETLLEEIARRNDLAPCSYRWSREGSIVQRTTPAPKAGSVYEFLRWISLEGTPFRLQRR